MAIIMETGKAKAMEDWQTLIIVAGTYRQMSTLGGGGIGFVAKSRKGLRIFVGSISCSIVLVRKILSSYL